MKKQLLFSLLALGLVGSLAGGGLFAHFIDTETSEESTFQAGTWYTNLQVDINGGWYDDEVQPGGPGTPGSPSNDPFPLFGEVTDIKPCHGGSASCSIYFDEYTSDPEDLYIMLRNIQSDEGTVYEPEGADTGPDGELDEYLKLEFWLDDDNDAVKDLGETLIWSGYPSDLVYNSDYEGWPIPNTPVQLDPNQTHYVGVSWHLDQNEGVNVVMGDSFSCEVVFATGWIP